MIPPANMIQQEESLNKDNDETPQSPATISHQQATKVTDLWKL